MRLTQSRLKGVLVGMEPAIQPESDPSVETILTLGICAGSQLLEELQAISAPSRTRRRIHRVEGEILAPLDPLSRLVALAVTDLSLESVEDLELLEEHFSRRCEVLPATIELLESAKRGSFRDTRTMDELWANLRESGDTLGFAVATAIALSAELPLQIHAAEVIGRMEPHVKQELLAYAVGRACRSGCRHARHLTLQLLASEKFERRTIIATIKGLGEGELRVGLAWIEKVATCAMQDAETWSVAARKAAGIGFELKLPRARELAECGLRYGQSIGRTTALLTELIESTDAHTAKSFLRWLRKRWRTLPFGLRGALLSLSKREEVRRHDHPCWAHECHPLVLLTLLQDLQSNMETDSFYIEWAGRLLFHWDERVRLKVLEYLTQSSRKAAIPRPIPLSESAEVIRLPATSMSRSALHQLQAAIWSADSESLLDIVHSLKRGEKRRAVKLMLHAILVPDMAMRREILKSLALVGTRRETAAILTIGKKLRTLEGHVVDALHGTESEVPTAAITELFDRRLKWADLQATETLYDLVGSELLPHLIKALNTRFFPPARSGAARTIASKKLLAGVFALRKAALVDSNEEVRGFAASGLRTLNCKVPSTDEVSGYVLSYCPIKKLEPMTLKAREAGVRALPGLRQTLANGSWMRRRAACQVLATIGTKDAIVELKSALLDVDEDVRLAALEALFSCGWKPKGAKEKTLAAIASRRLESLVIATRDRHMDTLNAALKLGGHVFRNEVLDLLERLPEWKPSSAQLGLLAGIRLDWAGLVEANDGVETTLKLLDLTWQSMPHRARLARGLNQVSPASLANAIESTNCGWRALEAVCRSLAREEDDDAARLLSTYVTHRDDDVRRAAFEALATVGTAVAAQSIALGLETPFREDRRPAAHALAAIGKTALPVLKKLASSDWWEYREAAAQAFAYWRGDRGPAVDGLLTLAVDPEPRVSQTAREALMSHGLRASNAGIRRMLSHAQGLTIEGLEAWLGFSSKGEILDAGTIEFLEKLLRRSKPDELMFRVDLVATLRATNLIPYLEELVADEDTHLGVALAASDTLRRVMGDPCPCCTNRGTVDCPGCAGKGEQTCGICLGDSVLQATCPDTECTAGMTMRNIASAPCKTCRGTGKISLRCECGTGSMTCAVCSGGGRIRCPLCDGAGTLIQR